MEQEPKTKIIKNLIIIAIFVGALFAYQNYYKNHNVKNSDDQNNISQDEKLTNCGLTVTVPKEITNGQFRIEAILDNNERETIGCSWTAFEAQTGVVFVKDGQGNDIANPTPLMTTMDWMTDDPVLYFADILVLNNYKGDAFVIINEEDPSGEKIPKTISFTVNIQ